MFWELVKVLAAGYLLCLAVAAALGVHRILLVAPARALYAILRLIVFAVTLGHLRLAPPARRAIRRQIRGIRGTLEDWRSRRHEELEEAPSPGWHSAHDSSASVPAGSPVEVPMVRSGLKQLPDLDTKS